MAPIAGALSSITTEALLLFMAMMKTDYVEIWVAGCLSVNHFTLFISGDREALIYLVSELSKYIQGIVQVL